MPPSREESGLAVKTTEQKARSIVSTLLRAGYPAYFVGGAVRDKLMGRPISDIDIATAAPPDTVSKLFGRTVAVGKRFGVTLVILDEESFEVATFRTEGPYRDGRRPAWVSFADAREDVKRRDFTINGLVYDPLGDQVIDWVEGRADIEARRVRTIGNPRERLEEDKLRMLRAVRLAANLNFQIEEETGRAIRDMAPEIRTVSRERIRDELLKLFTRPHADRGLVLMDAYGLLEIVLPEISRMKGVHQGRHHPEGDVFAHTVKILSLLDRPTVSLAFAALLHDVGKPPTYHPEGPVLFPNHARVGADMTREILDRLRFDRKTRERVAKAVANHLRFRDVRHMRRSTLRRFLLESNFAEELELHRLDCLAASGDLSDWKLVKENWDEMQRQPQPEPPLLRGRDLIELGFSPGPRLGEILRDVEEEQWEGRLKSRSDAKRWVKKHYAPENAQK